nr:MAG TPA: hypothetical protein [Caudoviricetes sp.]
MKQEEKSSIKSYYPASLRSQQRSMIVMMFLSFLLR